jgi:hypothetical protein
LINFRKAIKIDTFEKLKDFLKQQIILVTKNFPFFSLQVSPFTSLRVPFFLSLRVPFFLSLRVSFFPSLRGAKRRSNLLQQFVIANHKGWQVCWRETISSLHIPFSVKCFEEIASPDCHQARNDE